MDRLFLAFDDDANEVSNYLNLEIGGIVRISELSDSFNEYGNEIEDVDEFSVQLYTEKYLPIPGSQSHESYEVMEQFIETVNNTTLQEKLINALNARRPFRRFKDVLMDYASEEKGWFKFEENNITQRILNWLEENNLELDAS